MAAPKHVYETFVRATPADVWAAITRPEFTRRYFHHTSFEAELRPGGRHRFVLADGTAAVDGAVEEVDEPHRLVITWHVLYDADMAEEPPGRVEWVLRPANDDGTVTRVTLRHLDLGMSPLTSDNVALGWVGVLDSMKTLLETGEALGDLAIEPAASRVKEELDRAEHRRLAVEANGAAWRLLGQDDLDDDQLVDLVETAQASAHHWRRAAPATAAEQARAAWLVARCLTVAGWPDAALHHAQRCAALTSTAIGVADFDQAYAHEAVARALAALGRDDEARQARDAAVGIAIADPEDRAILEADLAAGPWFGIG